MSHVDPSFDLPESCRGTVAVLQRVLDADLSSTSLDSDAHASSCADCRERIAAARLMMMVLSTPAYKASASAVPSILARVEADGVERRQARRRVLSGASLAIAASLVLAAWLAWGGLMAGLTNRQSPELANTQPHSPNRTSTQPTPPPIRLGEEFAKAERALVDSSRPITEPAASAPRVLARITDVFTQPSPPTPEFEPARQSLLHLPEAARSGLEPVTATTEKAFSRLLKDVGVVSMR